MKPKAKSSLYLQTTKFNQPDQSSLAVPFQTIPKGGQTRAHFAAFLEFKDGKTVSQRNNDCYEP